MRITVVLTCIFGVTACEPPWTAGDRGRDRSKEVEELLRIDGAATLYPLLSQAAERFRLLHPEIQVIMAQSSSGKAVEHLLSGDIDIGGTSRPPSLSEFIVAEKQAIPLKAYPIAYDALAIVVHPDKYALIDALTREQVRGIFFDGSLTEWPQLHPEATGTITPYVRDQEHSGTAAAATKYITGASDTPYVDAAVDMDTTTLVVSAVARDPDGIGFAPFTELDGSVRALGFGEDPDSLVPLNVQTIRDLRYPLRRNLFLMTNGTPVGRVNEFIRFMLGSDSRDIYQRVGLTRLD